MSLSPAFLDELRARTTLSSADRAQRQAAAGRARMEGLLPVPQREDAELHRQRRKGLLPLLRLRRPWRRDPLADRRARARLHGRGQGAGRFGRHGGARARPARAGESRARGGSLRGDGGGRRWFVEQLGRDRGRARPATICRNAASRGDATKFGFGFAPDSRGKLKTALKLFGNDKLVETGLVDRARRGARAL